MRRQGLKEADLSRLAALVRGGEPWERIRTSVPRADPEAIDRFKKEIERRAAAPGPARTIPAPPTAEEEARQLEAWLRSVRPPAIRHTIRRGVR